MAYVRSLPINDTPEIFGLHENANITFAQNETYAMLATLLLLQPKISSGSGRSREEVTSLSSSSLMCSNYDVKRQTCTMITQHPGIPITIRPGAGVSYRRLPARCWIWTAERSVCVIQRCNNTFGDRSFAVAGPRSWNDCATPICLWTLSCKHPKTVLFMDSWGRGAFVTFLILSRRL